MGSEDLAPGVTPQQRYYRRNRDQALEYSRTRYEANPVPFKERSLVKLYGITIAQRDEIFDFQDRMCACCASPEEDLQERFWHTDHDHVTKVLRGIICQDCNHKLGKMGDSAASVATLCTWLLAYLARSGDVLSDESVELLVEAIRGRSECVIESTAVSPPEYMQATSNRPARANNMRLNEDQVRLVFTLRNQRWTQKRIASHLGVSQGSIQQILTRKTFKWVDVETSPAPQRF